MGSPKTKTNKKINRQVVTRVSWMSADPPQGKWARYYSIKPGTHHLNFGETGGTDGEQRPDDAWQREMEQWTPLQLQGVTSIYARGNCPDPWLWCENLTSLILRGSDVSSLPVELGHLAVIKDLTISDFKKLATLPSSLDQLWTLREINVYSNPLLPRRFTVFSTEKVQTQAWLQEVGRFYGDLDVSRESCHAAAQTLVGIKRFRSRGTVLNHQDTWVIRIIAKMMLETKLEHTEWAADEKLTSARLWKERLAESKAIERSRESLYAQLREAAQERDMCANLQREARIKADALQWQKPYLRRRWYLLMIPVLTVFAALLYVIVRQFPQNNTIKY